jgi:hypothetical protein
MSQTTTSPAPGPGSVTRAHEDLVHRLANELEDTSKTYCWSGNFAACTNACCAHRRTLIAEARETAPVGTPAPADNPTHTEETAAAAAQRFAGELSRLAEGLRVRGIVLLPYAPAGTAPVDTALDALDRARSDVEITHSAGKVLARERDRALRRVRELEVREQARVEVEIANASPTIDAILANARADADRAHQLHDEASDEVDRLRAELRQARAELGRLRALPEIGRRVDHDQAAAVRRQGGIR